MNLKARDLVNFGLAERVARPHYWSPTSIAAVFSDRSLERCLC